MNKIRKKSYPMVLIHLGDNNYLKYTINQIKNTNPSTDIIIIGDKKNSCYKGVTHYDLSEFTSGENKLKEVYIHLNNHPYNYEFFCMKRRFILYDRMNKYDYDECFYMDSDILIYVDILSEKLKRKKYEMAYTSISGHTIFINSKEGLNSFCKFILDQYKNHINEIKSDFKFINTIDKNWGISDMYMFTKYRGLNEVKIGNLQESDTKVFDGFLPYVEGYDSILGIKKIFFQKGLPYCVKNNKKIQFKSLHLQGHIKYLLIKNYIEQKLGILFILKLRFIQRILMPYIMPIRSYILKVLHLKTKSNII